MKNSHGVGRSHESPAQSGFYKHNEYSSKSPSVEKEALTKSLFTDFSRMNIPNPFPCIKRYHSEGVSSGSRLRSVVVEITVMEARDVNLNKYGLLTYSSMHSIDTPSPGDSKYFHPNRSSAIKQYSKSPSD